MRADKKIIFETSIIDLQHTEQHEYTNTDKNRSIGTYVWKMYSDVIKYSEPVPVQRTSRNRVLGCSTICTYARIFYIFILEK